MGAGYSLPLRSEGDFCCTLDITGITGRAETRSVKSGTQVLGFADIKNASFRSRASSDKGDSTGNQRLLRTTLVDDRAPRPMRFRTLEIQPSNLRASAANQPVRAVPPRAGMPSAGLLRRGDVAWEGPGVLGSWALAP